MLQSHEPLKPVTVVPSGSPSLCSAGQFRQPSVMHMWLLALNCSTYIPKTPLAVPHSLTFGSSLVKDKSQFCRDPESRCCWPTSTAWHKWLSDHVPQHWRRVRWSLKYRAVLPRLRIWSATHWRTCLVVSVEVINSEVFQEPENNWRNESRILTGR